MKVCDIAFSMGFSCGGTMALRRAGLQFVSYPLDWIGAPGIRPGIEMIRTRFENWLNREDLEFYGVRGGSFQMNIYRNRRTGYGFPHDFSRFRKFDEAYPEVAAKYGRRSARFLADLALAKRILVLYIERPIDPRLPDAEVVSAHADLKRACPGAEEVDLLYFYRRAENGPCEETELAPGVAAVGCEYAQTEFGEISHAIDSSPIAAYLKDRYAFANPPSPDAERRYEDEKRRCKRAKTGSGLDRVKYRLYRSLEKQLIAKGLVPRDFPLWFY